MLGDKLYLATLLSLVYSKIYFLDKFDDEEGSDSFLKRWKIPNNKNDLGTFDIYSGRFKVDENVNKGLRTKDNARFYAATSKLSTPFSNKGKNLIFQFSVKHEQIIDCGGGYFKLLSADTDIQTFNGDTPYYLMFGPDVCGPTRKVHVIISYKGKNHLIKKDIKVPSDATTHLYKFVLKPDQSYLVFIDNEEVASGNLLDDFDFLVPKTIPDPKVSKPTDWVEDEYIDDPEDKKPEDWDSIPEKIADPDAVKPEEWDDEMDGEWSAPIIQNPAFKGDFKPKKVKNPAFKGPWEHPHIPNPEYKADYKIYEFNKIGYIGLDIWQVKSGTIFDNIILTDDEKEAEKLAQETWEKYREEERRIRDEYEKEQLKHETKPQDGPESNLEHIDLEKVEEAKEDL